MLTKNLFFRSLVLACGTLGVVGGVSSAQVVCPIINNIEPIVVGEPPSYMASDTSKKTYTLKEIVGVGCCKCANDPASQPEGMITYKYTKSHKLSRKQQATITAQLAGLFKILTAGFTLAAQEPEEEVVSSEEVTIKNPKVPCSRKWLYYEVETERYRFEAVSDGNGGLYDRHQSDTYVGREVFLIDFNLTWDPCNGVIVPGGTPCPNQPSTATTQPQN